MMNNLSPTTNNVVNLNNKREDKNLQEIVSAFILEQRSENTKSSYKKDLKDFFNYLGKDFNTISIEDLINFKRADASHFREKLKKHYNYLSIDRKMFTFKKFYRYLRSNEYNVNPDVFDFEKLATTQQVNSRGFLHWSEVNMMIKHARLERKGHIKALLIEFAVKTSFRLNAILNLKWKNFNKINGVYEVTVIDKGKENKASIKAEMFEVMKEWLGYDGDNEERVFKIDRNTVQTTIKRLVEKLNLDPNGNRNITFHSLKKCGIAEAYILSNGDIKTITEQGNHSSVTSLNYYTEFENDPSKKVSLQIGEELDLDKLEDMSKEDLLKLIKESDRGTQAKLLNMMKDKD